jgi:hypothetical protein
MTKPHYVNNIDFYEAIKEHKVKIQEALDAGKEPPQISNYLGECLLKIATHLSYKPNFINYSYREDMILDGVENCLQYFNNFDPLKSKNPFAYYTQIIYYAFLRRITNEKKQTFIKNKIIMEMPFDAFELQDQDENSSYNNAYLDFLQSHVEMEDPYEKKKAKKLAAKTLENFMDDGSPPNDT